MSCRGQDQLNNNHGEVLVLQQAADIIAEEKDEFLRRHGIASLHMSTISRWMHAVGFQYKSQEKQYFGDGHEHPETLAWYSRPIY